MVKTESQNELMSHPIDSKEASTSLSDVNDKTNENFLIPTVNLRMKKTHIKVNNQKRSTSTFLKFWNQKKVKHARKNVGAEKASDKNIATLLRSEQLYEYIKKGCKIPYNIACYISQKTGFKTVKELNDYISAHRKKFIVLVDKKEKHCQTESTKCNNLLRRTDSVDLNLYLKHHYEDSTCNSAS